MDHRDSLANTSQLPLALDEAQEVGQFSKARDITLQVNELL
jgi:hypothetical protein